MFCYQLSEFASETATLCSSEIGQTFSAYAFFPVPPSLVPDFHLTQEPRNNKDLLSMLISAVVHVKSQHADTSFSRVKSQLGQFSYAQIHGVPFPASRDTLALRIHTSPLPSGFGFAALHAARL